LGLNETHGRSPIREEFVLLITVQKEKLPYDGGTATSFRRLRTVAISIGHEFVFWSRCSL